MTEPIATLPASIRNAALAAGESEYFARDVYRRGETPLAVVRLRNRDELRAIKAQVDPDGSINPGALGL